MQMTEQISPHHQAAHEDPPERPGKRSKRMSTYEAKEIGATDHDSTK